MTTTTQYLYTGPTTGITFRDEKGAKIEKMLFNGKTVDLPDCPPVQTLVALKRLVPTQAPTTQAPTPAAPAVAQATVTAQPAAPEESDASSSAAASSSSEQQKGA